MKLNRVFLSSILACLLVAPVGAATYYVDKNHAEANDANPGTVSLPWATVQHAADMVESGDTVIVKEGNYGEQVVSKALRSGFDPAQPITFKAEGKVVLKRFRIQHSNIVIDGFEFTGWKGLWTSYIDNKDVKDLKNIRILNNYLHDGVHHSASNVVLQNQADKGVVSFPSGGLIEAGIESGDPVHMNCDFDGNTTEHEYVGNFYVDSLSDTQMNVTPFDANSTIPNAGPVFCFLQITVYGISINADTYEIKGNRLHNLVGNYINLQGSNGTIEDNELSALNGYDAFRIFGENYVIRNNYVHDSTALKGNGNHPDLWQTWGFENLSAVSRNVLIEHNFFSNMESQVCMLQPNANHDPNLYNPGIVNYKVINNVFYNITHQANSAMLDIDWIDNTFVFNGGTGGDGGWVVIMGDYSENSVVNSVFVTPEPDRANSGWYSSAGPDFYGDYNYVGGPPPLYRKKADVCPSDGWNFCEQNGINGGDPLFQNIFDPVGPDGKPWTSDDGLIPLANSPLCFAGQNQQTMGAYECQECTTQQPIAYLGVDKLEGFELLTVNFDATKSLSCGSNAPLTATWDFGDGSTGTGLTTTHQYAAGNYLVKLTVTNDLGQSNTVEKSINVFPASEPNLVLYFNFDGNIIDMSGRENYSYWFEETAEVYEAGRFNQAASFSNSRSGSGINVRHKDGLDGTDVLSFVFWAKKETPDEAEEVVLKHTVYRANVRASDVTGYMINEAGDRVDVKATVANNDTEWHHYAFVYNGAELKLYFDGAEVDSKPMTGRIRRAPDRPLTIGKNPWGESFNGAMDDFKIYERELTPDDILAIFENMPQADTTAPTRRDPQPKTVSAGTTETTIMLTTNEKATCHWGTVSNMTFENLTPMDTTGERSHMTYVDGLQDGQTYTYYVRCQDPLGNTNESDFVISFYVFKPGEEPDPKLDTTDGPIEGKVQFGTFTNVFYPKKDQKLEILLEGTVGSSFELEFIDRQGNRMGKSINGTLKTSPQSYFWNGKNDKGETVVSGVYILRLSSSGGSAVKKVVVVK